VQGFLHVYSVLLLLFNNACVVNSILVAGSEGGKLIGGVFPARERSV